MKGVIRRRKIVFAAMKSIPGLEGEIRTFKVVKPLTSDGKPVFNEVGRREFEEIWFDVVPGESQLCGISMDDLVRPEGSGDPPLFDIHFTELKKGDRTYRRVTKIYRSRKRLPRGESKLCQNRQTTNGLPCTNQQAV